MDSERIRYEGKFVGRSEFRLEVYCWRRLRIHLISLVFAAMLIGGCSEASAPNEADPDPALGPVPVLWNMGVEFDTAFNLDGVDSRLIKFLEFGFEVKDQFGELKSLPHFTYILDKSIEIISPMEGVVASVHLQNELTQDYAIWLKPRGGPTLWIVEFDHLTKLAVAEGDEVKVGDLLGYPAQSGIELMVNGPDAHVCPFEVFDPEVAIKTQAKLSRFIADWDSAKWALPKDNIYHPEHPSGYYLPPYDSAKMVVTGCRTWEISYPE